MVRACCFVPAVIALLVLPSQLFVSADEELELLARLTPCEFISYFGYPCDVSYATTEDGYVLEVDRVFHDRYRNDGYQQDMRRRYPVLLLPGLTTSSDVWFVNYPSQSVGFLLADDGFDVWAMNCRETAPYSHHRTLQKDDGKYWKWSFDEIGRYDVAAGIDHVLDATGASKVTLFALSQSVVASLVLLATRPEYNDRVKLVVGYAPMANVSYVGRPLPTLWQAFEQTALDMDPENEGGYLYLNPFLKDACGYFGKVFCSWLATSLAFASPYQLNETRALMYASRYPIGISFQNVHHYYQVYQTKDFLMYDYGVDENLVRYSQATPPPYPLERIRVAFAIFSSESDSFGSPIDVAALVAKMQHQIVLHHVVASEANLLHFDFVLGHRLADTLHKIAIDTIHRHASINL